MASAVIAVIAAASLVTMGAASHAEPLQQRENATILVMGDSISAAYGIQREQGWVELLTRALDQGEYPYTVINASVSGETSSGGLARLPQALEAHDPAVVVIELGGNDGLRGYPTATIRNNLAAMVELVKDQGRAALLVGMQIPPNYGPRYTRAFHAMYADIAAEADVPLVPFFLEAVALEPGLMQDDGIHPTAEAQPLLLETLWTHLEPLLEEAPVVNPVTARD
jgi:acyl-CoA thioesterase-1